MVRWGVGKQGGGKGLVGERGEGGGCLRGAEIAEAGHVKEKEPKGRKASSITIGRSYSLSLVGVLVRVYKLVSSPALPQQTLVASYYKPHQAATGGLFYGRRYY